jgi:hypothetical protein
MPRELSPEIAKEIERFRKKAHVHLGRADRSLDRKIPNLERMLWAVEDLRVIIFSMLITLSGSKEAALNTLRNSKTYDEALFKLIEKRLRETEKKPKGKPGK